MNILQLIPELNVGGVETGTVDFSKYLVQKGYKSVVISNGGSLVASLEESGTKHYSLPIHKKSLFTAVPLIKKVRNIIIKEKIDIVHARSRVPAWIAYFACRKTKASFITTCHGYYKSLLTSSVMSWPKLIIVPSEIIGKHMVEDFNVSPRNVRCIPRSVDLDRFKIKRKVDDKVAVPIITMIGRITPIKGHEFFIKAMAKVIRQVPYVKIQIIGDAPKNKQNYKQDLEVLVNRLGIKDQVEFMGSRKDIPELLSESNVLVMSSVYPESFGRVILEAQAAKVPVVATKIGGIVDIIDDEKTGLLVRPKDVNAMAEAVLRLLKNKTLCENLVQQALKKIKEKFLLRHMADKTISVYEELMEMQNILIIKISSLGDVILITASLKAIRKKFPKAKIHCLVGKESLKILQNCPLLDGLIVYDHMGHDRGWIGVLKMARKLRKYRFDKVIDFQNNRKSHLLSFLSLTRESFGFKNKKWGSLLTNPVEEWRDDIAPVEHQFQVLQLLKIPYRDNLSLDFWISEKDKKYAKSLFDSEWLGRSKNIVGINISASEKWKTKNWPIEYIAQLCDMLSEKNIRVVITGMEKDVSAANHLFSLTESKPANFVGKTDVMQLAAIIKKCKVYVTPDSAPMHLAAAVKVPFVVFYGPTDSRRHTPPAKRYSVMEKKLSCSPCYSSRCKIMTHACLTEITPEEVFTEVMQHMGEGN